MCNNHYCPLPWSLSLALLGFIITKGTRKCFWDHCQPWLGALLASRPGLGGGGGWAYPLGNPGRARDLFLLQTSQLLLSLPEGTFRYAREANVSQQWPGLCGRNHQHIQRSEVQSRSALQLAWQKNAESHAGSHSLVSVTPSGLH